VNFPKYWALGRNGNFTSWRWSNSNVEEAQRAANEAANRLAAQFAQQGWNLNRYGYSDRPLREPVLREVRNEMGDVAAVVKRNSYGCTVLNAARAMFVDVDLPEKTSGKSSGWFASLFGPKQAPVDPAQAAIAKAEDFARQQAGWNWRIYRTPAGLRLLATHALFHPADSFSQAVFAAVDADPLYRKLCQTQECFRARLTPKPWRCEIRNPPGHWPYPDRPSELAFAEWDAEYQAAIRGKASCRLVSEGNGRVHDELRPIIRLHDEFTRATSQLPLA